ncbi:MAG TPA: RidA family protein [Acidimicrobiales bacterium]|nr:RidA family protein [Acidimicrobiales bacterium]
MSVGTPARLAVQPPELHDAAAMGYSHGVLAGPGRLLQVAGQVGEGASAAEQLDAALGGVAAVCRAAGGSMADVTAMTWYTTDPVGSLWADSAEVRRRWLPQPPPAMTVVQVAGLADPGYRIEVAATAVLTAPQGGNQP